MNCFSHQTTAAVGICKSCGKGLCPRCAGDTGVGLACRDACEDRVLILGKIVTNNARVMKTANAQARSSGLYLVLSGALFLAIGGWGYTERNQFLAAFLGGLGLIMLGFGLVRLTTERFPNPND
jgi:hypothetical protein